MSKFKVMKVFDCQDMPDDLKRKFFDYHEMTGNDCLVTWEIKGWEYREDDPAIDIDNWLIANGAEDAPEEGRSGEKVVIRHWW